MIPANAFVPYRLQVLQRLTAHLETISSMNPDVTGYQHELRGLVFRGRSTYGDNDPDTMLSILEAPRGDTGIQVGNGQGRLEQWSLLLQGWAPDDKKHPSDPLYYLAADVETCLGMVLAEDPGTGKGAFPDAYMLGRQDDGTPMIAGFTFSAPVIRPPTEQVSSKAFFYIGLSVQLATVVG